MLLPDGGGSSPWDGLVADIRAGAFRVDPDEIQSIINQLRDLTVQMQVADVRTRGLIPHALPAQVNSINPEADSTWNTLATGAKDATSPSLSRNMQDLHNVISWLSTSMQNSFAEYLSSDQHSAAQLNRAAHVYFDPADPGASMAPRGSD